MSAVLRRAAPLLVRSTRCAAPSRLAARPNATLRRPARCGAPGVRSLSSKAPESEAKAEEAAAEAAAAEPEAAAAADAEPSALEVAEAAAAKAKEETKELKDQLLRAIAEAENTRTIARRDVRNAKDFAATSFAKSILDVSDSLSYALKSADDDAELTVDKLREGVELTKNQLVKAFASNGLVEYGAADDAFDPALHEALFEYDDPDKAEKTVGQVVKTGFKLHDRVIRAAQVGVVKARS